MSTGEDGNDVVDDVEVVVGESGKRSDPPLSRVLFAATCSIGDTML